MGVEQYIVSIKVGSRLFAPAIGPSLVTLALLVLLVSLGRWQLRRADEKQALIDRFVAGADTTLRVDARTTPLPRYQHLEARGRYDSGAQVLIDNMVGVDGRAGYYVITPLALNGGGWLLVNRGWVPVGASRSQLPDVGVGGGERLVRGRADHLPSPGIRMGNPAQLVPPFPIVANFPQSADFRGLLQARPLAAAAEVVLLDRGEPDGYVRLWSAPGVPPMRHLAYAVQWFALAATLLVIFVVVNLRPVAKLRNAPS